VSKGKVKPFENHLKGQGKALKNVLGTAKWMLFAIGTVSLN